MEAKYNSRAKGKNVALLEQICALRHVVATKLGHASHAHYKLTTRMAKDPATVRICPGHGRTRIKRVGGRWAESEV